MKNASALDSSSFSRRRFIGFGGLAVAASVLPSVPRSFGADAPAAVGLADAMPEAGGVFEVAPLPYAYDALNPVIDTETMTLHHDKHYAGYTKKLNAALAKAPDLIGKPIEDILASIKDLPGSVRKDIRNNGGGYVNHSLFWRMMTPNGGGEPTGDIAAPINETFGSFADLKTAFSDEAASVFGSGWAWLVVTPDGKLEITSTPNQDSPLMADIAETPGTPILGLDVWEHAYYLKYKNERKGYISAWWDLVNWNTVDGALRQSLSQPLTRAQGTRTHPRRIARVSRGNGGVSPPPPANRSR